MKRKRAVSKRTTANAGENVFEQLGFSAAESRVLTIKADLLGEIRKRIQDNGLTQAHVAKLWGQAQPRVSEIMNGRLESVTIDKLVDYLDRLGIEVTFSSKKRA